MDPTPDHQALAAALLAARSGGPLPDAETFTATLRDADDAFAVQDLVLRGLGDDPARCRAWKSGGPSRTATLTHAPLPTAGIVASGASAAHLPLIHRMIEAEVALRLGRDVTADIAQGLDTARLEAALELVDGMAVTIELVDGRWAQGFAVPPLHKLADLQCHGGLVIGDLQPWQDRDWSKQACEVRIGGASTSYVGTHALGHPAWLLPAWLRHATRQGQVVPAGTLVTTGTWCGLLAAAKGDLVQVAFDGIGQASVQL